MTRDEIVERLAVIIHATCCHLDCTGSKGGPCEECGIAAALYAPGIQSLLAEAGQRASAGMQAAAAGEIDPSVTMSRPLGTAITEWMRQRAKAIRSLTLADGTNALDREKAKARLDEARYWDDSLLDAENWVAPTVVAEHIRKLEREAGGKNG